MIPTQIRLVSLTMTIARTTTTNILILVLMSLPSAPITVDSHLSSSSDPHRPTPHIQIRLHPPPSLRHIPLSSNSHSKSRYSAASCAFGHRLFLTSYMLSSKVICDNTHSNKVSVSCLKIAHTTITDILILAFGHYRQGLDEIHIHDECRRT